MNHVSANVPRASKHLNAAVKFSHAFRPRKDDFYCIRTQLRFNQWVPETHTHTHTHTHRQRERERDGVAVSENYERRATSGAVGLTEMQLRRRLPCRVSCTRRRSDLLVRSSVQQSLRPPQSRGWWRVLCRIGAAGRVGYSAVYWNTVCRRLFPRDVRRNNAISAVQENWVDFVAVKLPSWSTWPDSPPSSVQSGRDEPPCWDMCVVELISRSVVESDSQRDENCVACAVWLSERARCAVCNRQFSIGFVGFASRKQLSNRS